MKNDNTNTTKINRYTILDAEVKRVSKELKEAKKLMETKIQDAINDYRAYRKNVYKPAREAAFKTFADSKVVKSVKKADQPKAESKPKSAVKKQEPAKVTGTDKSAAECIAAGEKAIAEAKAAVQG